MRIARQECESSARPTAKQSHRGSQERHRLVDETEREAESPRRPTEWTIRPRETPAYSVDERYRRGEISAEERSPESFDVVEDSGDKERR